MTLRHAISYHFQKALAHIVSFSRIKPFFTKLLKKLF